MNEKNCKEKVILDDNGDKMRAQWSRDARSSELSVCSEVADLAFDTMRTENSRSFQAISACPDLGESNNQISHFNNSLVW